MQGNPDQLCTHHPAALFLPQEWAYFDAETFSACDRPGGHACPGGGIAASVAAAFGLHASTPGGMSKIHACVGGDVAANLAAALGAQVKGHRETLRADLVVQVLQDAASLAHQRPAHLPNSPIRVLQSIFGPVAGPDAERLGCAGCSLRVGVQIGTQCVLLPSEGHPYSAVTPRS